MLARLAFNMGDHGAAQQLVIQAGDHAEQIDDAMLTASVAAVDSILAFYRPPVRRGRDNRPAGRSRRGSFLRTGPPVRIRSPHVRRSWRRDRNPGGAGQDEQGGDRDLTEAGPV
ncbi:hypothetical protein MXD63_32395 [Frankia sp. Cpl3]|nr:hypothetical protein [Frankia sp. Cpl3]